MDKKSRSSSDRTRKIDRGTNEETGGGAGKKKKDAETKAATVSRGPTRPGAVSETIATDTAQSKKMSHNVLRVIEPTKVRGPNSSSTGEPPGLQLAACAPVPNLHSIQSHHTSAVGNDQTNKNQKTTKRGLRHIPPSNAPGIVVATQVSENPPEEDTQRMATEIADLQVKLKEHDTRDIVLGITVSHSAKDAGREDEEKEENGRSRILRQRLCVLFSLLAIGGVVVVTLALKNKPAALPSVNPTMSPATLPEVTDSPLAL
eukprot:Nitzschia sp. Nitz4//scaffold420_size8731//7935//8711//NITZ4_009118-RA/size8731-processed-gene-0.1-mRNA-1//1//CDS//3329551561//454//frame0